MAVAMGREAAAGQGEFNGGFIMKLITMLLAITLCLGVRGVKGQDNDDQLTQFFRIKEGYAIYLPSDWEEIPQDVILSTIEELRILGSRDEALKVDYAYQLTSSLTWFECPYIVVAIKDGERIPESELKDLRDQSLLNQSLSEVQSDYEELFSRAEMNTKYYDVESNRIWWHLKAFVQDVGYVEGIGTTRLTEEGRVTINCYALMDEFNHYSPLFHEIIQNFFIPEHLRYKRRLSDSIEFLRSENIARVLGTALALILISLLVKYLKPVFSSKAKWK